MAQQANDEYNDYDIIPHKEILRLRREVDEIKAHPLGHSSTGKELLTAMNELNKNITNMFTLFKDAAEEMKLEESEAKVIAEKMAPMMRKFDVLVDQNEKIAKGILAVADMVKGESKAIRGDEQRIMQEESAIKKQEEDILKEEAALREQEKKIQEQEKSMRAEMSRLRSEPIPVRVVGEPRPRPKFDIDAPESQPFSSQMPSGPGRSSMPPLGGDAHLADIHHAPGPQTHGEHFDMAFSGMPPQMSQPSRSSSGMPPQMSGKPAGIPPQMPGLPKRSKSIPPPPHAPAKKKGLFG